MPACSCLKQYDFPQTDYNSFSLKLFLGSCLGCKAAIFREYTLFEASCGGTAFTSCLVTIIHHLKSQQEVRAINTISATGILQRHHRRSYERKVIDETTLYSKWKRLYNIRIHIRYRELNTLKARKI
ncbi:hypothetical protein XELAEV_18027183mg [Xenopus laevis]|uniref:Uncharacterized protein n=1 Tax=Xenopus laevis TaxID=8355 RepID=A0A974HJP9_XENLA|nr:hypothetical protein XELAEV_18027183mg [Xenopus laevis]